MLTEYETEWLITSDESNAWSESVIEGTHSVFSLTRSSTSNTGDARARTHAERKAAIFARQLTLQSGSALRIGRLNSDALRAFWSSLLFELRYLANDDDERHSIQAHRTLLRNLSVQCAAPPLGYVVYASPPLLLHTW